MSTETFESIITHIPAPIETVYATLSDLNNVSRLRDAIPQDRAQQIKEMRFDADSCTISVDPVGELTFRVVMREPNKTIKFTAENSPIPPVLVDTTGGDRRAKYEDPHYGKDRCESLLEKNDCQTAERGDRPHGTSSRHDTL